MRYAIISDVHANEAALRAVLTDAADAHAERIVCLGDVLGYGPDPVSTLELVYRRAHVCLAGNHDDAVSNRFPVDDFSTFAAAAVARHRAALSQEAIDWLRYLPHVCEFGGGGPDPSVGAFACAHGEFSDPKNFGYVLEAEDALPSWKERPEQLLFVGHSHKPGIFVLGESGVPHALEPADFMLEPGKRYLVNVGSVGYPRTGVCRSFYCIYDDCSRTVFFRSLPFDLEAYSEKMHGKGLDEAPWMRAREKERQGHEVRRATNFANETPQQGSGHQAAGAKRRLIVKPRQSGASEASDQQPKPLVATGAGEAMGVSRVKMQVVALAAALLLMLVFVIAWGVHSARKSRDQEPAQVAAASRPAQERSAHNQSADVIGFTTSRSLAEGWMASFERSEGQSAERVQGLFRVASNPHGTVRLVKSIPLSEKQQKVYWSVKLVKPSSGKALPFEFDVKVKFFGKDGALLGRCSATAKRSAQDKHETVPSGAVRATMEVDCACAGTYDMEVPYFSSNPRAPQAKPPAPPKPAAKRRSSRRGK